MTKYEEMKEEMKEEIKRIIEDYQDYKPFYWIHLYLYAYLIKNSNLKNNEILELIKDAKGEELNEEYENNYVNTISRDATTIFDISGQDKLRDLVEQNKLIEFIINESDKQIPDNLKNLFEELFDGDIKEGVIENEDNNEVILNESFPLNQILYGPPGTGKTYHTINKAVEIADTDFYNTNKEDRSKLKERFTELKKNNQIVFTTFHQSMSYEEFVEGLKPYKKDGQIFYEVQKGIFRQICEIAQKDLENNYVLIIDEINRGNIASIFGELITLIESDKRQGAEEDLFVQLPYSKAEFTVPKNLYIIGTMNTADRSVEALDSALRRRFVFNEMPPDISLLKTNFHGINLQKVLERINIRIEKLIDKDHEIGHSYFMNLSNIDDLINTFKNKVIPLLEEYFYGDFVKIGLILGEKFIKINNKNENIFKIINSEEDYTDFENRIIYKMVVPIEETEFINAVKNIYEDDK